MNVFLRRGGPKFAKGFRGKEEEENFRLRADLLLLHYLEAPLWNRRTFLLKSEKLRGEGRKKLMTAPESLAKNRF